MNCHLLAEGTTLDCSIGVSASCSVFSMAVAFSGPTLSRSKRRCLTWGVSASLNKRKQPMDSVQPFSFRIQLQV